MKKGFSIIVAAYSAIMLIIFSITVNIISRKDNVSVNYNEAGKVTEYVYVYVGGDNTQEVVIGSADDDVYIIRQYMERIGIFKADGTLMEVLEVYVKTLPEADKRLLGEGIEIIGKSALNSIIEDYSS